MHLNGLGEFEYDYRQPGYNVDIADYPYPPGYSPPFSKDAIRDFIRNARPHYAQKEGTVFTGSGAPPIGGYWYTDFGRFWWDINNRQSPNETFRLTFGGPVIIFDHRLYEPKYRYIAAALMPLGDWNNVQRLQTLPNENGEFGLIKDISKIVEVDGYYYTDGSNLWQDPEKTFWDKYGILIGMAGMFAGGFALAAAGAGAGAAAGAGSAAAGAAETAGWLSAAEIAALEGGTAIGVPALETAAAVAPTFAAETSSLVEFVPTSGYEYLGAGGAQTLSTPGIGATIGSGTAGLTAEQVSTLSETYGMNPSEISQVESLVQSGADFSTAAKDVYIANAGSGLTIPVETAANIQTLPTIEIIGGTAGVAESTIPTIEIIGGTLAPAVAGTLPGSGYEYLGPRGAETLSSSAPPEPSLPGSGYEYLGPKGAPTLSSPSAAPVSAPLPSAGTGWLDMLKPIAGPAIKALTPTPSPSVFERPRISGGGAGGGIAWPTLPGPGDGQQTIAQPIGKGLNLWWIVAVAAGAWAVTRKERKAK